MSLIRGTVKVVKKRTFDDILPLIRIEEMSSIKTLSMLYLAYKLDKLTIYVNNKRYTKPNIHTIPMSVLLEKPVSNPYIYWGDGGALLSCISYDNIIGLMEDDRLNGIVLHY